jgi:POT family proton-dependent oligopeptide transporter
VLFVTELWERFAYYGMRSLLILYLIDTTTGGMGWNRAHASHLYGWYNGLAYLTPVAGGWIADRYLGNSRSLILGSALISAGHFSLALGQGWIFYGGLTLIVLGTGFFKPNVYTMVGQLYGSPDPRRDAGFTLYYMGINLGALFGPLICAWLAANPRYGWSYGFGAAGTAMLIGLLFFLSTRRVWLRDVASGSPIGQPAEFPRSRPSADEWKRILALGIITVFVVFFWLAFEQIGSSLNLFAAQRTNRLVGGWLASMLPEGEVPAAWFQAVNPLFVLLLAPIIATLWHRLGQRGPTTATKMAIGLLLLGGAYVIMVAGAAASDRGTLVSPGYLVSFYFVYSVGELCFLPAGFSFVGQAAPRRMASMLMGLWFTANFVANLLGGYLAGTIGEIERGALVRVFGGQADFFLIFVVSCTTAGVLLWLLIPLIRRLMKSAHASYSPIPAALDSPL